MKMNELAIKIGHIRDGSRGEYTRRLFELNYAIGSEQSRVVLSVPNAAGEKCGKNTGGVLHHVSVSFHLGR